MSEFEPYVVDTAEQEYPFPERDFLAITEDQVAVVIENSSLPNTYQFHLFQRETDGLFYKGLMSDRGTFTEYDQFNPDWNQTAAELIEEETPYTIKNKRC